MKAGRKPVPQQLEHPFLGSDHCPLLQGSLGKGDPRRGIGSQSLTYLHIQQGGQIKPASYERAVHALASEMLPERPGFLIAQQQ
jgi:hypothetical protein